MCVFGRVKRDEPEIVISFFLALTGSFLLCCCKKRQKAFVSVGEEGTKKCSAKCSCRCERLTGKRHKEEVCGLLFY